QIFDTAMKLGLGEKIASILDAGLAARLCEYYQGTKQDLIPKELLFDWFLEKYYSEIHHDEFKLKLITFSGDTHSLFYETVDDGFFDEIHTRFRSFFPWCNITEQNSFKKIQAFALRNKIDTKINYFKSLPLTSNTPAKHYIERLVELLYVAPEEQELAAKYLTTWFTGLVQRSLHPGSKFDLVLVVCGEQGVGKTTFLENIFPEDTYTMSNSRDLDSKDKLINLSTNSIVIWDEIGSFSSKYMIESIKQFLTLTKDSFRPVYGRQTIERGRRCVFCATTNDPNILEDLTGNRRFMVITVGDQGRPIEQEKIKKMMPELLSVVQKEYLEGKLLPYLSQETLALQTANNMRYQKEEPLVELVEQWLRLEDGTFRNDFQTKQVAEELLGVPQAAFNRDHALALGKVLRKLGYHTFKQKYQERWVYLWRKNLN
ncbi:MAG: VapE domain-containing protein, partial [Waterburya sp.]